MFVKEKDFDKVWEEHCRNDECLRDYAKSMLDLATEVWDEACDGKHRIQVIPSLHLFVWVELIDDNSKAVQI